MTSELTSTRIPSQKIYYLDTIKLLLTGLVILHHTMIAYGAPGGWYFKESTASLPAKLVLTVFVAANQSFFMGMFFMLSAYFVGPSYERKGAATFVIDRLKRLGIPLLIYSFVLATIMNFLVYRYGQHHEVTFWQFVNGYDGWISPGVMWFVEALLLFTLIYVAIRQVSLLRFSLKCPGTGTILLGAVVLGLISFLVRIVFPVGWVWEPFGFQFAHFPQYVALFGVGILAQQNNWFDQLSQEQGRFFGRLAVTLAFLVFPLMVLAAVAFKITATSMSDGWSVQSFLYSIWEQLTGISIIVALLWTGKQKWNYTTPRLTKASRYAFAMYVFHPLVVISLTLLLSSLSFEPLIKLVIAAPLALLGSYGLAALIVRSPGAKQLF
ncbi:acyltransferase family protein [Spirosoma sp. KUDC1026]|uniref:acyltransferase family protein n=1 Tax=Spirosoma sp. KUDC1026 TaxID=2745947 RepID=UPI00159BC2EE|nr:acyltransferase [Spirosoma sp. KUDC1026]QKZ13098.1 acyltransferase [Spirosoma sp. KUDC1026]